MIVVVCRRRRFRLWLRRWLRRDISVVWSHGSFGDRIETEINSLEVGRRIEIDGRVDCDNDVMEEWK